MDEQKLKQLFDSEQISVPDENVRKVTINLAVAEFEKNHKTENNFQGTGFFSRLIHRQPLQRREKMSFSNKKIVYGGLATACVALMVFTIAPDVMRNVERQEALTGALQEEVATSIGEPKILMDAPVAQMAQNTVADAESKVAASSTGMAKREAVQTFGGAAPAMAPVVGLAAPAEMMSYDSIAPVQQEFGRDKFKNVDENPVKQVAIDPVSTFSIDVDTSSYAYARSSLNQGVLPQKDSVRVEEMVNYFDYDYPVPAKQSEPFSTNVVMKPSPWGEGKQLMTIGIKGYDIPKTSMPNSNLVFLLDTSGSMEEPNKLPLLKQSISMLLDSLKPTDTISIVVYAGSAGTVLPPTKVADKGIILMALQNLSAGGGTAGAEGIRQAYQLAGRHFDKNAVNRVILGTDGDFNVGITNPEELKDFVEREKDKGIFLSVLGFGRGNYNDEMMQVLAQNGNGVAAYIDSINEARKVLVEEATSTLFPIAKDVKIQVEFNPSTVAEYRLVGYETRALRTEDFNNDKVDAGDIGAGAEVTAIYEITPKGGKTAIDESRYAPKSDVVKDGQTNELAFVKLRYKLPNETESKLITTPVTATTGMQDAVLKSETDWAVAVASFAQLLKGGAYTGKMSYDDILKLAEANKGVDPFGYRAEFITLVYKAKVAASLQSQPNGQGVGVDGNVGGVVYPYPVPMER